MEPCRTWFQVSGGHPKPPRSYIGRTPSFSNCRGKIEKTSSMCLWPTGIHWLIGVMRNSFPDETETFWTCDEVAPVPGHAVWIECSFLGLRPPPNGFICCIWFQEKKSRREWWVGRCKVCVYQPVLWCVCAGGAIGWTMLGYGKCCSDAKALLNGFKLTGLAMLACNLQLVAGAPIC